MIWLLFIREDDESSTATTEPIARTATSPSGLVSLAEGDVGHPIYWVGDKQDAELEVHRNGEGEVFLRYLTGDAEAGDPREKFLTVGTYPVPDAYDRLQQLAEQEGSLTNETPDGGFVLTNESNPTSVYVAYPDVDLQIEVFDPDPERAFKLASSGDVVPVS